MRQPCLIWKDLCTGVQRSDPRRCSDGDLDEFMAASLAARVDEEKDKRGGLVICVGGSNRLGDANFSRYSIPPALKPS